MPSSFGGITRRTTTVAMAVNARKKDTKSAHAASLAVVVAEIEAKIVRGVAAKVEEAAKVGEAADLPGRTAVGALKYERRAFVWFVTSL